MALFRFILLPSGRTGAVSDEAVNLTSCRHDCYQPRSAKRCRWGTSSKSMPTITSPRLREALAMMTTSSKKVVAFRTAEALGGVA